MRERRGDREAWTRFIDGGEAKKASKYGNERAGKYASKRESEVAGQLAALERCGLITNLREQEPIILVPSNGKLRAIKYIADFTYNDSNGKRHIVDAKGFKTQIYRLKKRMAALLSGVEIEEV